MDGTKGNGSPWEFTALDETERRIPVALVIDGLELKVSRYDEGAASEGIVIYCIVEVDRATTDRLTETLRRHRAGDYFPVVRRGLEEAPKQMRFGGYHWSDHGATVKYELSLFEKAYDDASTQSLALYPEMTAVLRQVGRNTAFLDRLAADLLANGQLTRDRLLAIRQGVDEEEWDRVRELRRLKDVDPSSRPRAS